MICPYCKTKNLKIFSRSKKLQQTCGELKCRIENTKKNNREDRDFYRKMKREQKNETSTNTKKI